MGKIRSIQYQTEDYRFPELMVVSVAEDQANVGCSQMFLITFVKSASSKVWSDNHAPQEIPFR
jgi:hypothetical protein